MQYSRINKIDFITRLFVKISFKMFQNYLVEQILFYNEKILRIFQRFFEKLFNLCDQ